MAKLLPLVGVLLLVVGYSTAGLLQGNFPRQLKKSYIFKEDKVPRPLYKSSSEGGSGGTVAFDDIANYSSIIGIHSINISSGNQVDSIEVIYILSNKTLFHAPRRGRLASQPPVNISLVDEEIVKIEGKTNGMFVDQLTFTTVGPSYLHKQYGPFGRTGQLSFSLEGQVIGFFGRHGDMLDNIGIYSLEALKKSSWFGDDSGDYFDDYVDLKFPPIVKISRIFIWSNRHLTAYQVEYLLVDGSLMLGKQHGPENDDGLTTITFGDGEVISALEGATIVTVAEITITTTKQNGEIARYGPFGEAGDGSQHFSIQGKVLGFFGSAQGGINGLGVYYI